MSALITTCRIVAVSAALLWAPVPMAYAACDSARQADLDKDFKLRLKPYLQVREKAKSGLAASKPTTDPAELQARQELLAERIRAARATARQGDILGPPITDCLIPLVRRNLTTNTAKRTTKEGNPAEEGAGVKVAVNAPYPPAAPLSTMPPALLTELPKLPAGLEYRFIGRTLILYDADACLIVDFLPNAGA